MAWWKKKDLRQKSNDKCYFEDLDKCVCYNRYSIEHLWKNRVELSKDYVNKQVQF